MRTSADDWSAAAVKASKFSPLRPAAECLIDNQGGGYPVRALVGRQTGRRVAEVGRTEPAAESSESLSRDRTSQNPSKRDNNPVGADPKFGLIV